ATATDSALVTVLEPPIEITKLLVAQVINPGDAATFTITVSNPGTLPLTGVSVDDPASPDCDATLPDIPPAGVESYDCDSDPVFEDFTNVATVTATAGTTEISASASAEVNVRQPIVITKAPAEQTVSSGETATFTITLLNEGTDTKTDVAVADPLTPDCDRAASELGDLEPNGGTITYACTTEALAADLLNEATVTATGDTGPVTDSDTALVVVLTDLVIAKTPELQQLEAGETATFTIEVTNDGDQVVTDVAVADPATPACEADLGDLDPGESVSYECTTEPLFADLTNVATVSGEVPQGEVRATATAVVEVVQPLVIAKEPPEQEIQAGETADFTITVSNPSDVTRTDVAVSDPLTPSCDRPVGALGDLGPGEETTYGCTTEPLFADLPNVATATAIGPSGEVSAVDSALVVVLDPEISITKTPDVQLVIPGAQADFTITLTNPGPGDLTGIAVSDPLTPDCDRPLGVLPDLPPGVSTSYDCLTGPLTEDFVNVATVTATSDTGIEVSSSASAAVNVVNPIEIVKGPIEQTVLEGEVATFTITLTNDGETVTTDVAVSDPLSPDCDRPLGTLPDLEPSSSFSYVCVSNPVVADFVNVATVTAISDGIEVTASASAFVQAIVVPAPQIEITKTPEFPQVFAGSTATFTIGLRNTGNIELLNLTVSDPLTPDCDRTVGQLTDLQPGEVTSYTCETEPLFADLTNVATVTADPPDGPPISAEATAFVEVLEPVIEITKDPAEQQILAGETATFTITVTNLDDDGLTDLVVVDPETIDCERGNADGQPVLPDLPTGQTVFYDCTTEALGEDLTNVATVSAVTREGLPVSTSDSALVTVIPPIEISKSPDEQEVLPGETATFTITLANPGSVPKTDVQVTDPLTPDCDNFLASLPAGATFSYTCDTGPLFADLLNIATVTADSAAGTATASDAALVTVLEPPIEITKLLVAQVINP
ncbi:MAG: DUF11 domain-containing protein, partial [Colwellia sp.]|nr:DUF11 domain-containing protein [Colwellia sp.]